MSLRKRALGALQLVATFLRAHPTLVFYAISLPLFMAIARSVLLFLLLPQGHNLRQASDILYDFQLTLVCAHATVFLILYRSQPAIRLTKISPQVWAHLLTPGVTLANLFWVAMAFGGIYPTVFFSFAGPSLELGLGLWFIRMVLFVVWFWVDALIFLNLLPTQLVQIKSQSTRAAIATLVWILFKLVQLNYSEIAILEWITLACIGYGIAIASFKPLGHRNAVTFALSILATLHFIYGLPILAEDLPGLFVTHLTPAPVIDVSLANAISGGENGPLAGLACVSIFLFDLVWMLLKNKGTPVWKSLKSSKKPV